MTLAPSLLLAALALVAAAVALTRPNAVHAVLWVVASLLALAGAFFALGAGFAGAVQIVVYAGAVLVVFVFVVLTLDLTPAAIARERARMPRLPLVAALAAALVAAPVLAGLLRVGAAPVADAVPTPKAVGALLFGPWAIAVELASFLLLAGLVGVRHVGRRPHRGEERR
ncbi:MAG: NADH-quinone oxidoreductase subunit J [Paracoccaceae bacterium]